MQIITTADRAAYEAGIHFQFAKGDVFQGAMPEAKAAGYERGTSEYDLFVTGYIKAVKQRFPNGPLCDDDGVIVED